jgi:ElaB/YqjD/DUF883 family membrane-anchored ribosome-binding protein
MGRSIGPIGKEDTMTAPSPISNNDVRETREEACDAREAALGTCGDIQSDLQVLRDEFRQLAAQVGEIVTDKGGAAWRRARPRIDGLASDAQEKGREAVDAVIDVTDIFVDAIDKSLKNRPSTTLALFAALGFALAATRRR